MDFRDSIFTNNTATNRGGGVFALDFDEGFTCEKTNFTGNVAGTDGGGVSTFDVGAVNFTSNDFVRNRAGNLNFGGGFFVIDETGTDPLLTNVSNVFVDNAAPTSPNSFASGFSTSIHGIA